METAEFSFALFPDVEEEVQAAIEHIYGRSKSVDSAAVEVRFTVDTLNQKIIPEVRTKFPSTTSKVIFPSHDLIDEGETFRIEKPKQVDLFKGEK